MSILLDTNVLSELRKLGDGKADPEVAAWIGQQHAEALIAAIALVHGMTLVTRNLLHKRG